MNKLLNKSLKQFTIYAGIVLALSVPVYYVAISKLWQYELDEHNIMLTPEAGQEDTYLILGAVTLLTIFFFMLLLGGFVWLNRKVSGLIWQPFYKTLSIIKSFDLNARRNISFPKTDILEFAELNQGLDKLITGSIDAYNQQKEFADNASHELQTPMAIIQSKLEMLQQSSTLTNDQYTLIEQSLQALARVNRVNKNLLLLTRIENSQFMDQELLSLSDLLTELLSLSLNFAENKMISLRSDIERGFEVKANRGLVEIMLNNLLTNAIRHGIPGSSIAVILGESRLVIRNSGSEPLQQEQLFRRFAAASSQAPSTGLGLAIVKQISERYGWKVGYDFINDEHVFSLSF